MIPPPPPRSVDDVERIVTAKCAAAVTAHRRLHGNPSTVTAAYAERDVIARATDDARRQVQRSGPDGLVLWRKWNNRRRVASERAVTALQRGKRRGSAHPDAGQEGTPLSRSGRRQWHVRTEVEREAYRDTHEAITDDERREYLEWVEAGCPAD